MALLNPPSFEQAGSFDAQQTRLPFSTLLNSSGGVVGSGDLAVTALSTPNMSVNVAAGQVWIPGTFSGYSYQGQYYCLNDGTINVLIPGSDPTYPRIDLIVAQVLDAAYGSASSEWQIVDIEGTASSSPVIPTAPASSIVLAQIAVGAAVSSITSSNITDERTFVGLGAYALDSTLPQPVGNTTPGTSSRAAHRDHVHADDPYRVNGAGLATVGLPTVTNVGTTGTTVATYQVTVANPGYQESSPSPVGLTTTGNATLSSTNYNVITWPAPSLPAGSPGNLVYDSDLTHAIDFNGATWINGGNTPVGSGNGEVQAVGNSIVYTGTGTASNNVYFVSQPFSVIGGESCSVADLLDTINASSPDPQIYVTEVGNISNLYSPIYYNPVGQDSSVASGVFTMPNGVTSAQIVIALNQTVVTAGAQLKISSPQLTKTSTVQPYQPGPLFTYNVYKGLYYLGNTTALGFEDQGATVGTQTVPQLGLKTTQVTRTYAVSGSLALPSGGTNFLPPFFMTVSPGETVRFLGVQGMVRSATSVTLEVQQNGSNVSGLGAVVVGTTATRTYATAPVTVSDGDAFAPVLTAISGTPDGLSLSFLFEVTA